MVTAWLEEVPLPVQVDEGGWTATQGSQLLWNNCDPGYIPEAERSCGLQTPQCECCSVGVCMWTGCLGSEKSRAWLMPTQWFLSGKHLEVGNRAPSQYSQWSWRARHLHLLSWLTLGLRCQHWLDLHRLCGNTYTQCAYSCYIQM